MHVISRKTLEDFWKLHPLAEKGLRAWLFEAKEAEWENPDQIKARYPAASFLADNRVVFNIGGNKFRLIVRVRYESGTVFIRFVGTHSEYDSIERRRQYD